MRSQPQLSNDKYKNSYCLIYQRNLTSDVDEVGRLIMPLEKRPSEGTVSEGVNSSRVREVALGMALDFKDFHIQLLTFP